MVIVAIINSNAWNFIWNLAHLPQGSLAPARAPSKTPDVGTIKFVKASPSWKATTATCLVTPTKSARGAIIGIVSAA